MNTSTILQYGQPGCSLLYFSTKMIDIDAIVLANLIRLMKERNLKQKDLARLIKSEPQFVNAILKEKKGIGRALQAKLCSKLNVEPWEFYWTEKTPVIKDDLEQQDLFRRREARAVGVAEDTAKYETFRIEEAKKKDAPGSEGKEVGVPRRTHKRAG